MRSYTTRWDIPTAAPVTSGGRPQFLQKAFALAHPGQKPRRPEDAFVHYSIDKCLMIL